MNWVFGYGSLVSEVDPLIKDDGERIYPVWGWLQDFKRGWNVAAKNLDPLNDLKFYVDPATRQRPAVYTAFANVWKEPGAKVFGLAVPVDKARLIEFDEREVGYNRIDVTALFDTKVPGRVWCYVGHAKALKNFKVGQAAHTVFIPAAYYQAVEEAFKLAGLTAHQNFLQSTERPDCPVKDLVLVRQKGQTGY